MITYLSLFRILAPFEFEKSFDIALFQQSVLKFRGIIILDHLDKVVGAFLLQAVILWLTCGYHLDFEPGEDSSVLFQVALSLLFLPPLYNFFQLLHAFLLFCQSQYSFFFSLSPFLLLLLLFDLLLHLLGPPLVFSLSVSDAFLT